MTREQRLLNIGAATGLLTAAVVRLFS